MLTGTLPVTPGYSHAEHSARCRDAAQEGKTLVQRVQVMRRGVVYCASIKNAYSVPKGPDCWTVNASYPESVRLTVACSRVIPCSPESCACVVPESKKGVTCL